MGFFRILVSIRALLAALVCFGALSSASAQVLEDAEWRREGNDAVLQIGFSVPIQFLRSVVAASGDQVQAFYQLRPRGELPQLVIAERRVNASEGLPAVSIADEAVTGLLSRKLVIRLDRPARLRVRAGRSNCCIDVVVLGAGPAADVRTATPPAAKQIEDRFLITLQSSTDPNLRMDVPVPGELQAYQVFTSRRVVDGKTLYEINLGYFTTRDEANRAQRIVQRRFPDAQIVELTPQTAPAAVAAVREPAPPSPPTTPAPGAVERMPAPAPVPVVPVVPAMPAVPVPGAPPVPAPVTPEPATPAPPAPEATQSITPPAPTPSAPGEIDQQGRVLLAQGRAALDKGDNEQAVGSFNQLLNLPPNAASQDGQELIGIARARLGDVNRARAEFELYLKLYPTGAGADRVRAELAKLGAGGPTQVARRTRAGPTIDSFNGSFSQYYFGGRSQITQLREGTPLQGVPVPPTQDPISNVDQKQLQSSLDLSYRHRDAERDIRAVFRDVYTKNFLDNTSSFSRRAPNRLNAAYVEYKALPTGFVGKLGRQSPSGGDGVLYRFDGARLGYQFTPKLGAYAVAGEPSDDLYDAKRRFYGLSLLSENMFDHLTAAVYGNEQKIDGQTDRRGVGTELRFFSPQTTVFGTYDYDLVFRALNIATVQATWQAQNNAATVTALYDKRTGPILTLGNALLVADANGVIHRSVNEYLATTTLSLDQLRALAKATTTYVDQKQIGVTFALTTNLQLAANASRTNIGAVPAYDPDPACQADPLCQKLVPAQPATGNIDSYGAQFIASNLYSERDSHVFSLNLLRGETFKGRQFSYNNLTTFLQNWQFEPSIRYFGQTSSGTNNVKSTRWTPAIRLSWRLARKLTIEGNVEYEMSRTTQPDTTTGQNVVEKANRTFFFLGYRVEF